MSVCNHEWFEGRCVHCDAAPHQAAEIARLRERVAELQRENADVECHNAELGGRLAGLAHERDALLEQAIADRADAERYKSLLRQILDLEGVDDELCLGDGIRQAIALAIAAARVKP